MLKWLLLLLTSPLVWRFRYQCRHPRLAQQRVQRRIAGSISKTGYGKHYGVVDAKSFRSGLPIVDYDELRPWLERQRVTEDRAIVSERVLIYEKTSGSSGASKSIPYNRRIQWSFTKMFLLWAADVARAVKGFGEGRLYFSVSPSFGEREQTEQGKQVGLEDDTAYLSRPVRVLMDSFFVQSPPKSEMGTPDAFKESVSKCLLKTHDLESISVWNPSFLMILLDWMETHRARLLEDEALWEDGRRRAAFSLESIQWSGVWPKLKFISCWADANARPLATELQQKFPDVWVQGKGLLATEAPMTIPWAGVEGGVPLLEDVYFEFETEDGQILELHELELGQTYEIIVSQVAGLCRYRMGDLVRVVSYFKRTPTLEFVGRGNKVSDLVGEKLNEAFVGGVLEETLGSESLFRQLIPKREGGDGYILLVDQTQRDVRLLAEETEAALCRAHHYEHARALGQLAPLKICIVPGAADLMNAFYVRQGLKLGDIKQSYLASRIADSTLLADLSIRDA